MVSEAKASKLNRIGKPGHGITEAVVRVSAKPRLLMKRGALRIGTEYNGKKTKRVRKLTKGRPVLAFLLSGEFQELAG